MLDSVRDNLRPHIVYGYAPRADEALHAELHAYLPKAICMMHNIMCCSTDHVYHCSSVCCCMHWTSKTACMHKHECIAWSLHHKHDSNTDKLSIMLIVSCPATAMHLAQTHLGELIATASACLLSFLSEVLLHQLPPRSANTKLVDYKKMDVIRDCGCSSKQAHVSCSEVHSCIAPNVVHYTLTHDVILFAPYTVSESAALT